MKKQQKNLAKEYEEMIIFYIIGAVGVLFMHLAFCCLDLCSQTDTFELAGIFYILITILILIRYIIVKFKYSGDNRLTQ